MTIPNIVKHVVLLGSLVVWGTLILRAQDADSRPKKTGDDITFARDAASGGRLESQLGKLAQEKGKAEVIKEFGKKMETDHSKTNEELMRIVGKDQLQVPVALSAKDQGTFDKLSKLSGSAFDRAYGKFMVEDHQNDIEVFKKEAESGQNPDLRSFASRTLPALQDHLNMAQEMVLAIHAQ